MSNSDLSLKGAVQSLLDSVKLRVGTTRAKDLLEEAGFDTRLGWEQLVSNLIDDNKQHKILFECLNTALRDMIMYGSRMFEAYNVEYEIIEGLLKVLDENKLESFCEKSLLDIDKQQKHDHFEAYSKDESGDATIYCFLHVSLCNERIEIDNGDMRTYKLDNNFDKIYGVRKSRKLFFNSIRFDKKAGRIFVLIDRADEVGLRTLREIKDEFLLKINELYYDAHSKIALTGPVNYFGKVQDLYSGNKGSVTELKFICPSGTVRHEELKARNFSQDLREEIYHSAGMNSIDYEIDPFHISLKFQDVGELTLLGQKVMANGSNPKPLTEGLLRFCYSGERYSKLLEMLDDC